VVALAALDALRARALLEHGAFKDFYSALSDIVRRYLEDRFGVRAPEMTTEEFLLSTSRDGRLATAHRRLLGEFLTESDLVVRGMPTIADSERALTAAPLRRRHDPAAGRSAVYPLASLRQLLLLAAPASGGRRRARRAAVRFPTLPAAASRPPARAAGACARCPLARGGARGDRAHARKACRPRCTANID
jgi:hypothetical protein